MSLIGAVIYPKNASGKRSVGFRVVVGKTMAAVTEAITYAWATGSVGATIQHDDKIVSVVKRCSG